MFGHDVGDRVRLRRLLQILADPRALGPLEDRVNRGVFGCQRPVVEIGA